MAELRITAEAFQLAKNNHGRIEDCHFIFHAPDGATTTIGVADGVGGCRAPGIDPGEYSEELMLNALAAVIESAGDAAVDPIKILKEAHCKTAKPGASTACIITLAPRDGELRFANVGDSGFKVFRRNAVAYESPIQQKRFNHPFQLYKAGGRKLVEESAVEGRVTVEAGDVVVAGTDGLFDNLYGCEIERILESAGLEAGPMELDGPRPVENDRRPIMELARVIALTAFRNSLDPRYVSPYQTQGLQHGRLHRGGKPDDITVVVARIESVP